MPGRNRMTTTTDVDRAVSLTQIENVASVSSSYEALLHRYAAYAPTYDRRWSRYTEATLAKAFELLPSRIGHMLDVACGTGILLTMVRDARPDISVVGVDLSPDMLEKARARMPESPCVRWARGSAEQIPAGDASFDILTCTNAFHLVQDSRAALAEFRRVLRPRGAIVIVDWCHDFAAMRLLSAWLKLADRQFRRIRTLDQMVGLLRSQSFEIDHAERFRATRRWGLLAIRARLHAAQ